MVVTADLRNATRERPGASGTRPGYDSPDPVVREAMTRLDQLRSNEMRQRAGARRAGMLYANGGTRVPSPREQQVTCAPMWTAQEFRTFRHLVDRCMDPDVKKRQEGEVWMRRFREKHGDDVCRMMLAEIRRLDEVAWFKRKTAELKGY